MLESIQLGGLVRRQRTLSVLFDEVVEAGLTHDEIISILKRLER